MSDGEGADRSSEPAAEGERAPWRDVEPTAEPKESFWTRLNAVGTTVGAIATLASVLVALWAGGVFDGLGAGDNATLGKGVTGPTAGAETAATEESATQETASTQDAVEAAVTSSEDEQPQPEESPTSTYAIGDCLRGDTLTSCAGAHDSQVFALGDDCHRTRWEEFVAAREIDVLRPDVSLGQASDGSVCLASLKGGKTLTGSAAAAFDDARGAAAAQLRHCLDDELRPVSCLDPHHGEVVAKVDRPDECNAAAMRYLGWESFRLPGSLSMAASEGSPSSCVVTVKGDNVLTGTLRAIGRHSIPVSSGS